MQTYLVTISVSGRQRFIINADTDDPDYLVSLITDDNQLDEYLQFDDVVEVEQVDERGSYD